jgi:hypothetical protein
MIAAPERLPVSWPEGPLAFIIVGPISKVSSLGWTEWAGFTAGNGCS